MSHKGISVISVLNLILVMSENGWLPYLKWTHGFMAQNFRNVAMVCMGFHNNVTLPPIQTLTRTVIMAWLASSAEEKYLEALPQMNGNQGTVSPWNVLAKSKLFQNSWLLWPGCQWSYHHKILDLHLQLWYQHVCKNLCEINHVSAVR